MGKNKLKKFAEMETLSCVLQYPFARLQREEFPLKGKWNKEFFGNDNPIVLELGCGKGEYAVGLAQRFPGKNYIGIDCKGARMWTGATQATAQGISNVAFLRTDIELINHFFEPNEVSEIWITFPDPQMKKARKRLTGTRFLQLYRGILTNGGIVHLKTDSPFLYTYTSELLKLNNLPTEVNTNDLYHSGIADDILEIKTYYEQQWLSRGLTIKYLKFHLPQQGTLAEPDIEIEEDTYRSFSRGYIQCPQEMEQRNQK
ncbi:MAG: tRNA (guanosine(46)-N7)-methyltransferase TrmB [Muribaculaceae bacterium]